MSTLLRICEALAVRLVQLVRGFMNVERGFVALNHRPVTAAAVLPWITCCCPTPGRASRVR